MAGKLNKLEGEKSPYLEQHASNPVDWYPWGEEAFEKARKENKPVLLSIGYSTCHWCHVMAREVFEDEEAAGLLNEVFVAVKVDREERPDLDNVYMTACQMMTGRGGWPLTILLTPDRKPFFAATYLPKESRFGQTGMMELARRVREIWKKKRDEVLESADSIADLLSRASGHAQAGELAEQALHDAYLELSGQFDPKHGGFGRAPKFPTAHTIFFLLRYWKRTGEKRALEMALRTLDAMSAGGIHDHLGFGFHRYSTDAEWLVPHFEKMLYDQALLAMAYTEACQATGKEEYGRVARSILEYVRRDMTSPEGGFYSAEDADSEREEGKFYVWASEEVRRVLGDEEACLARALYGIREEGNFSEQETTRKTGANILHIEVPLDELAARAGISVREAETRIEKARLRLLSARGRRVRPHRDDKILADWNGLMIAAYAGAAQAFGERAYEEAAMRAADFVLGKMRDGKGRLFHRHRDGQTGVPGMLDDYAFLIHGLIELYEAGFEVAYLEAALGLTGVMLERFWDAEAGGFFFTADDVESLLVRKKETHDGATPSGNSMAMLDLLRLGRMTGDPELEEKAASLLRTFSGTLKRALSGHTQFLTAFDFGTGPSYEVVIVGREGASDTEAMLKALRREFMPNKVVLFKSCEEDSPAIVRLARFTLQQTCVDGKATAYVCRDRSCGVPLTDPQEMLGLLGAGSAL